MKRSTTVSTEELLAAKNIQVLLSRYRNQLDDYCCILSGNELPPYTSENKKLMEAIDDVDLEGFLCITMALSIDIDAAITRMFVETIKEIDQKDQLLIRLRSKIKRWIVEMRGKSYGDDNTGYGIL